MSEGKKMYWCNDFVFFFFLFVFFGTSEQHFVPKKLVKNYRVIYQDLKYFPTFSNSRTLEVSNITKYSLVFEGTL